MIDNERIHDQLTVHLSGEIDHHAASQIRTDIDDLLEDQTIRCLLFDFENVSFMDSSGIGMMIGRYRIMKKRNGSVFSTGMNQDIERIYRISGLHRIIPIEKHGDRDER